MTPSPASPSPAASASVGRPVAKLSQGQSLSGSVRRVAYRGGMGGKKITAARQYRLLCALEANGQVALSCASAEVPRRTHYGWLRTNAAYAAAVDLATQRHAARMMMGSDRTEGEKAGDTFLAQIGVSLVATIPAEPSTSAEPQRETKEQRRERNRAAHAAAQEAKYAAMKMEKEKAKLSGQSGQAGQGGHRRRWQRSEETTAPTPPRVPMSLMTDDMKGLTGAELLAAMQKQLHRRQKDVQDQEAAAGRSSW